VSGNIVISDGQGNGGHGVMMTQVQDAGTPTVQSPGTQVIVNRHVEYINVYSRYNDISDNDIVYTTATGLSGAAGFFEQAYKVIKDEGYPFGERLFWADADLPDDWNFFGTQDGQPNATPKPFQKNRYHLVSGELHWSWDNTGDGWPETISLADFKEQDLDKDATIDGNIDYRYWFEKWNTGRTAFHASGDGDN
jgi:hypothetical protein